MAGDAETSAPNTPNAESRTDPDADVATRAMPDKSPPPVTEEISIRTASVDRQDDRLEDEPSSVRPSSPTLPTTKSSAPTPVRPIVVRTTPPPSPVEPIDVRHVEGVDGLPQSPATTTPTGLDPSVSPIPRSALRPQPTPLPASPRNPPSNPTPTPTPSSHTRSSGRGLVGATLGRYEIAEEVGHGGMATVYRALDPRLDRNVALKVIHPHLRDNPEIAHRFRHEARAVAKLKHPAIVEIYDVPDAEGNERFLVAEYVDGPSLRKWLQQTQKEMASQSPEIASGRAPLMPPEIAGALVLQVLSALARAHQEGIVHRDVKPENILLAGLGAPASTRPSDPNRQMPMAKLTDFGIAKILDAQSMTSTGQILGSPAHMAPEQIEGGDVSPRVDVFATGVLFYELLTGALPFDGKNPAQVIRRVLDGQFTAADRIVPTVGGRWASIVATMLTRDPEKRPENVDDVAASIRRELEAIGIDDANRELADYLRDPTGVMRGWGERVKQKLLDRAVKAREQGDTVGAANDLNRALAYDPGDPKLMRVVSSLRTRERRLAAARRAAPMIVLGALVVGGTFLGVRKLQENPMHGDPSARPPTIGPLETTTTVSPSVTVSASTTTSAAPSTSATGHPSILAAHDAAVAPPTKATRMVRFNIFPAGVFTVDGEGPFEPLTAGTRELGIGEHTITATGDHNCCAPYSDKIKVVEGDGVQLHDIHLVLRPAHVFLGKGPEGVTVTITVRDKTGGVLATGPAPLDVPMNDTSVPVTIIMEAAGFPVRKIDDTLSPNDTRYEDFQ